MCRKRPGQAADERAWVSRYQARPASMRVKHVNLCRVGIPNRPQPVSSPASLQGALPASPRIGGLFLLERRMRYEVRKANQGWHVFDTEDYSAVAAYPANMKRLAVMEAAALNAA